MQYRIKSIEDLLIILKNKHPNFDYTILNLDEYKKKKKVSFVCPEHDLQNRNFYDFLSSNYGCTKCA